MSEIRIARVSSVNYRTGMARVFYEDRDSTVTKELPYLSMNDEFSPPKPGDKVLVAYLSNGETAAVILGTIFSNENPANGSRGSYCKKINDKVAVSYDEESDTLCIKAPKIKFVTDEQNVEW